MISLRALAAVGLSGFEGRCPHHLSFGEKRKVCIAAVLSMEPEVLVLDELTSNLDPRSKSELIKLLKSLNEEGKTIIIATHDVRAVAEMAERVYILNKAIITEGKTREIFSVPEILQEQNLDVPEIAGLFHSLRSLGYSVDGLPLSVEEAVRYLVENIPKGKS